MLFAIDAAHKLGQQDEPTEVLLMGDAGEAKSAWTAPLSAVTLIPKARFLRNDHRHFSEPPK